MSRIRVLLRSGHGGGPVLRWRSGRYSLDRWCAVGAGGHVLDGRAAEPAASCSRVGLVRVAAHRPDHPGDVFLVPGLAVDRVRVPVAGEEACGPSVAAAGREAGLAAGAAPPRRTRASLLVRAAAGALAAPPRPESARFERRQARAASAVGTSAARGGPGRGSRRSGSGAWCAPSSLRPYAARRFAGARFRWRSGWRSAITLASSCGQQPHLGVRSPGRRPWAHSWSARRPSTPASIGHAAGVAHRGAVAGGDRVGHGGSFLGGACLVGTGYAARSSLQPGAARAAAPMRAVALRALPARGVGEPPGSIGSVSLVIGVDLAGGECDPRERRA